MVAHVLLLISSSRDALVQFRAESRFPLLRSGLHTNTALEGDRTARARLVLAVLAVGLLISVFQAATQINEMTLSFIPKLLAMFGMLVLLGPWLIGLMVDYIRQLLGQLPGLVS